MSSTTALTAEFRKVIPGKFVTQRDGSPMPCTTCGADLVMGATFAATNGDGWTSYCAACADSFPFQVRGLVSKLTTMGVTIPEPIVVIVRTFLTNESTATALAAKSALLTLRSERGAATAAANALDLSKLPSGCYAVPGGDTRLKVKIDVVTAGKWAGWVFVKDAAAYGQGQKYGSQKPGGTYSGKIQAELRAIADDLTGAAAAYGHLTGKCSFCSLPLELGESVARGYGKKCASNHGLPWG